MKKGDEKGRITISINPIILKKFKEYCKENSINKSDKIEKLIADYMKKLEEK